MISWLSGRFAQVTPFVIHYGVQTLIVYKLKRFLKTPGGTAYWKIHSADRKGFESCINEKVFGNTEKAAPPNKS